MSVPSYLLKVAIKDTPNLIWRRFVVPADLRLDRLHSVLQTVLGWRETRPHSFEVRKQKFAPTDSAEKNVLSETAYTLLDLVSRSETRLKYRYGDWFHDVTVENIRYINPVWPFPIYCLEGLRRCPPETCSNVAEFIEYLKTANDIDFDPATVNKAFGVAGPIPIPVSKSSSKKAPASERLDPFQRLGRLLKTAAEVT